jgi:hypothetical protein
MSAASWYHCSVKPVSRSAGRSVVAAAAYRLGERLHDQTYDVTHDYTRKRGVEASFTVTPEGSPAWAHDPEQLWNAAEAAEKRRNSTLAREVELALPSFLSAEERQGIVEDFAAELVERYGVAVSVALHEPGKNGDDRNYHAHILFTTREMTPDGLGKKTRILDDRKTGPGEVVKLRELAAGIINDALREANSDIRVDHRSFKERGIEQEPTTHLGPAASEMERRGEPTERGEFNRHVEDYNAMLAERAAVDAAIRDGVEELASPPRDATAAQERMLESSHDILETIAQRGEAPDQAQGDGLTWWQRGAVQVYDKARELALAVAERIRDYWQGRPREHGGGIER